jgi:hypothetical protein
LPSIEIERRCGTAGRARPDLGCLIHLIFGACPVVEIAHREQAGDQLVPSESSNPLVGRGRSVGSSELRASSSFDSVRRRKCCHPCGGDGSAFFRGFCPGCSAVCNPCGFTFGWRHRAAARTSFGSSRVRCRSANRERARLPQVVLLVALPASFGYQTSWCLCCTLLMGTAVLVKRGSRLWDAGSSDLGVLHVAGRVSLRGGIADVALIGQKRILAR